MSEPGPLHRGDDAPPDLLWHGAHPWARTGYGEQSALVLDGLDRDGYRTDLSTALGASFVVGGRRIWMSDDLSAADLTANATACYGPRAERRPVVALTDYIRLLNDPMHGVDLVLWLNHNFDPAPEAMVRFLHRRRPRVLAVSRWGQRCLADAGIESTWLPHGVDLDVFTPGPGPAGDGPARDDAARDDAAQLTDAIPGGAFVVGIVAANTQWEVNRKCLPEALAAFARFRERAPDAVLYLHTEVTGSMGGIDLDAVRRALDLPPGAVLATPAATYRHGIGRRALAGLYRRFDVLLAASGGEGFGLPVIEAQACGTPVVVSDFSSQPELVGAGRIVGGQRRWDVWNESWLFTPSVDEIADALWDAYDAGIDPAPGLALARSYDHRALYAQHWRPFLHDWIGPPSQPERDTTGP